MEKRRYRFWDPKANVNIVEISNELYVIFQITLIQSSKSIPAATK